MHAVIEAGCVFVGCVSFMAVLILCLRYPD